MTFLMWSKTSQEILQGCNPTDQTKAAEDLRGTYGLEAKGVVGVVQRCLVFVVPH